MSSHAYPVVIFILLCVSITRGNRIILVELQRDTVDTVPLIGRVVISLALEHMSQMSSTVTANNLRPLHTESAICMPRHRTRDVVKVRWPSTARLELVFRGVKRCIAAYTCVDAFLGVVLVVFTGEGCFGALLAYDAELLLVELRLPFVVGARVGVGHLCGGWG